MRKSVMRTWSAGWTGALAAAVLVAGCGEDELSTGFAGGPGSVAGGIHGPGAGLTLGAEDDLVVDFEGSGSGLGVADTVARSDHDHGTMVPAGGIIMWSGTLATIPAGWGLCDGSNGTPDLRDRFILSVSTAENPGATGGSHNVTLTNSNLPNHRHSFTTGNRSVPHNHWYGDWWHTASTTGYILVGGSTQVVTSILLETWSGWTSTITSTSHNHTGNTNYTGGGASFDNRPVYYKLAFIMKL